MNRFSSACFTALALFYASSSQVYAHATLEVNEATQGGVYKGVVRIGHGCNGSPTLNVKIKIPEGIVNVKPMPKAGWTVSTVKAPLAQPYESHGKTITEGVSDITWSGGKLLDEHYDEFVFRSSISARAEAGSTLYIPVTQTCETGQAAWTQIPVAGEDAKNLKSPALTLPAPALKIVAAKNASEAKDTSIIQSGDITITQPWSKEMPAGAKVAAGYMVIKNGGADPDRLLSVESPYANSVEIHEMSNANNVMTMRKLETGLDIKVGSSVQFVPNGYHVMFMGVKDPVKAGSEFPAVLLFEKAGRVNVMFKVQSLGAGASAGAHSGEHKH